MKRSFFMAVSWIFLIIPAMWFFATLALSVVDRDPPVTVTSPSRVTGGDFKPGGWVAVQYRLRRDNRCTGRVTKAFTDAQGVKFMIPHESKGRTMFIGERDVRISAPIPAGAAHGVGRFSLDVALSCWYFQQFYPMRVRLVDVEVTVSRD